MRRVSVILLVVLAFGAGLILDTAALLELIGSMLWAHWRIVAVVIALPALAVAARRRFRRRVAAPKRGAAAPRRTNGTKPSRAGAGRTRKPPGRNARA